MEKSKRLIYCPVQGFTAKQRDTFWQIAIRRYEVVDETSPFLFKCVIAALCGLGGEYVFQKVNSASTDQKYLTTEQLEIQTAHKANRMWAIPVMNTVWVGAFVSGWTKMMNTIFPLTTARHIATKAGISIILMNPLYTIVFIAGTHVIIKQNHVKEILKDRYEESVDLMKLCCYTGPAIYAAQYLLIPPDKQVLYLCLVNFLFTVGACTIIQ